jgi:uncharacterized membrane protein YgcG
MPERGSRLHVPRAETFFSHPLVAPYLFEVSCLSAAPKSVQKAMQDTTPAPSSGFVIGARSPQSFKILKSSVCRGVRCVAETVSARSPILRDRPRTSVVWYLSKPAPNSRVSSNTSSSWNFPHPITLRLTISPLFPAPIMSRLLKVLVTTLVVAGLGATQSTDCEKTCEPKMLAAVKCQTMDCLCYAYDDPDYVSCMQSECGRGYACGFLVPDIRVASSIPMRMLTMDTPVAVREIQVLVCEGFSVTLSPNPPSGGGTNPQTTAAASNPQATGTGTGTGTGTSGTTSGAGNGGGSSGTGTGSGSGSGSDVTSSQSSGSSYLINPPVNMRDADTFEKTS